MSTAESEATGSRWLHPRSAVTHDTRSTSFLSPEDAGPQPREEPAFLGILFLFIPVGPIHWRCFF